MEQYIIALILGVIEGITECIPVSSTGHMIIIGHMLNFEGTHADVFEVFIQIGAILAIYTHYRRTFNGFLKRKNWIKTRGVSLLHISAGMLPVLMAGYLLQYIIKEYLFGPIPVIVGLIIGAIFMIYAEKRTVSGRLVDSVNNLTIYHAFKLVYIKCFVYGLDFRALAQPLQEGCLSAVHGGPQLIFRLSWLCLL